jgi:hypothetical protein
MNNQITYLSKMVFYTNINKQTTTISKTMNDSQQNKIEQNNSETRANAA